MSNMQHDTCGTKLLPYEIAFVCFVVYQCIRQMQLAKHEAGLSEDITNGFACSRLLG
jgi:hypothetical protein